MLHAEHDNPYFYTPRAEFKLAIADYRAALPGMSRAERINRLTGSAFEIDLSTGEEGRLWLDGEDGHVVDAVMPVHNHPGNTDFRLRLLNVSDGGEAEWTALLRAHFEGCEG